MPRPIDFEKLTRVKPGRKVKLHEISTTWEKTIEMRDLTDDELKSSARDYLDKNLDDLAEAQELLWADDRFSVLVVLQALDAAGKDGTIKHVMKGVNPQGCQVSSFKRPSAEEIDHDFLWRYAKALPERGSIGIFNRSYYEDVLVVRVHPEILDQQRLPGKRDKKFWKHRFEDINALERHLVRNGTAVVKFFLHVSRDQQKKRLLDRLERADKYWKFSTADIEERAYWDDYMKAYEDALTATNTTWAPWHIVPADHKWVTRALVANVLIGTIRGLKPSYPKPNAADKRALAAARKKLLAD